ncbi:hypothetical protein SCHPADRAFT_947403 [Schizopora paradoxa]|uniref:Uncharacterized protein n=1 Tax=Schizopora paradoxa TaxID=27342 RepID=A0A0H2R5S9_9AGAM|nr:hypothetical protein SCHPADRAFT_947403 [Schizopora paradoxa]
MSANNRASLLANLRTGGVRSASSNVPQTAAPTVTSFQLPDAPMTAAPGGSFNDSMYSYLAPNQVQMQQQAQMYQMQMLQAEIMKMQIIQQAQQAQQYQLELMRQQQQQQAPHRRTSLDVPASAGPTATSFMSRRASQAEYLKNQLHLNGSSIVEEEVPMPMTGALNGKFGGRLNPNATSFKFGGGSDDEDQEKSWRTGSGAPANTPVTPSYTTVISGGTALGKSGANGGSSVSTSKSDGVANWRRGGNNNSMLNSNRSASLSVKITPPPADRTSPSPTHHAPKTRPEPLRFSVVISEPVSGVTIDNSDGDVSEGTDDASSNSDSLKSESLPTTPPSNSAVTEPPLSPREVASKRLYEGLGLGRPVPQSAQVHTLSFPGANENDLAVNVPHTSVGLTFPNRAGGQPMRQPRGPPCGIDELGSKNFATRIRRKAIGGLGAMLDARVNRREVEAF